MSEYSSGRQRNLNVGINSFSENTTVVDVIGNIEVRGKVGVGTTLPTQDVDVRTIRIRDTVYDYTNYGGALGYYLTKDTGGIKWVAVPPIDSNAIFIAENNNILGVSSFTGLNIVSDELLGISTNAINPNFADIIIIPRWAKSGETGIYTSKNVGIGTTIPTADFQVGFGTTGVTIDGASGIVSAIGYYGDYLIADQVNSSYSLIGISTISNQLVVVGQGSSSVAAILASSGGIVTTGGDLYVGKKLYAGTIDIDTVVVNNVNSPGVSTFNVSYTNIGIVTYLNVTGIATINNLNVTGFSTFVSFNASSGVVTNLTSTRLSSNTLVVSGITTLGNFSPSGIVTALGDLYVGGNLYTKGIQYFDSIGAQYLDVLGIGTINVADINNATIDYTTGIAATITRLNSTSLVSSAASFSTLNVSGVSTFNIGPVLVGGISTSGTANQLLQIGGGALVSGKLGVGTTNPSTNLDVLGNGRFTGVVTATTFIGSLSGNATSADFTPYALISGISSNVIGGIGSVSRLTVSGVSTFTNGPVLIGSALSTGTASQTLQVTGGGYISSNLGIGTTTPTANLDVVGGGRFSGVVTATTFVGSLIGNATSSDFTQYAPLAGISTSVIGGIGSVSRLTVSGVSTFSNGPVIIGSATSTGTTSQPLQVTGGVYISGSVGIGTTIPTQSIDLMGGLRVRGQIYDRFNNVGDQGAVLTSDPINASWYWAAPPPFQIGILTALDDVTYYPTLRTTGLAGTGGIGSASYLQIDNVVTSALSYKINPARLGIGTTNPITNLDVVGNGRFTGIVSATTFIGQLSGNATTATSSGYSTLSGIATNVIGGIGSVSRLIVSGISTFSSGPVLIGSGTSSGATNQPLQVTGNGFISGRLGIGTTNPTSPLHIIGDALVNGWGYFNSGVGIGTTSIVELRHYNVNNGTFSVNNLGGNQMFSVSNVLDNTHEFKINQYLGIGTATRSVFTVDNNGSVSSLFPVNIAVGQSNNYQSQFNSVIWGEVNIRAPYTAIGSSSVVKIVPKYQDLGALSFESPVGTALTDRGTQIFSISNNLTSTIFRINDANRNTILEATSTGNVGIGTTLPLRKFQVTGTTRITSVGSTTNEQIDINHYRNIAYPLAGSQPTTNNGALSFDSPAGISTNGVALFPASLFAITNDPTGNIFSVAGYRYFSGSPWPVIDVTQNGRLGIGTTTPQEEVHVIRNTLINADVRIIGGISSNVTIGGSVGIGTTSLFVGLDVNTNSQFRSRVAFSQTGNPSSNNVFDITPITTGITSWAPPGGALVMTENRTNSGQTSGQIYTLENNDESLFRVNTIGFGLTTVITPTNPIYQVIDVNPAGDIRIFDTETRKILSSAPGFSSTTPGDGDFLRIDTYTTPFIGSFPTVSKAIRLDKFGLIELNRNVRQISGNTVIGSSTSTGTVSQNLQVVGGAYVSGNVGLGTTLPRTRLDVEGSLNVTGVSTVGLSSTSTPTSNSSFSFELTNNTTLTVRVRGTDGVVRTGMILLI